MELKGKKIVFLGDSITEAAGLATFDDVYWNVLARNTGAEVYGYGIGGSRIARQHTPSADPRMDRWFASRVEEMIPDADIIVVFGGTNDFGHGDAAFGRFTDRTDETFCGACHDLMVKLINRYPDAQILFMTPLHRTTEENDGLNEWGVRRQGVLEDYVNMIIRVAGHYGIPVLDLFRTCKIQPNMPVLYEKYTVDGLHPNKAGHELIAHCLQKKLEQL